MGFPLGLSPEDIQSYYELLSVDIADYDCGTLCAPLNDGIPFCCSPKLTIPLLYRSELALLQQMGDLWSVWNPGRARSRRMLRDLAREEVYCQCRGIDHCIREQRSLSCRTYPLEPYIDEGGKLAGLVFLADFMAAHGGSEKTCPLVERPHDIRQEFIDRNIAFWKSFLRIPAEFDTYRIASRSRRRREAKTGTVTRVLRPSG